MGRRAAVAAATIMVSALVGALSNGVAVADEPVDPVDPVGECVVDEVLVNSCRPWFGASANRYPQVSSSRLDQLLYFEQRAGRAIDVAHTYHAPGDNELDSTDRYFATRPDTYLLTNWKPSNSWAAASGGNATVDAGIDAMAESIKSLGDTKIFLVLHHEPENDVSTAPSCANTTRFGRAGTPDDYKAMWANVHARFDAAGVTNVVWVMDYMGNPEHNCLIDDLYPGDELVDWIGFNAYQHNDTDVSFERRVSDKYDFLAAQSRPGHDYLSKPWALVEWGIHNSTQRNAYTYYAQAAEAVESGRFPQLQMYLTWDSGNPDTGDASHRVSYADGNVLDPAEQVAYQRFAGSLGLLGHGLPADAEPPGAVEELTATVTTQGVSLAWAAPADDVGVTSYEVLRNGEPVGRSWLTNHTHVTAPSSVAADYTVRAVDGSGKVGPQSAPVTVPPADRTPPTVPSAVVASLVNRVPQVSWAPSTDLSGVSGYDVYRDGVRVATVSAPPYLDAAASQARNHTWRVRARDVVGNISSLSTSATLFVPDRTPPSAPGSLSLSRSATSARLTWTAATDNVGVAGYIVYRGTTVVARLGSSARAATVSGLRAGTSYSFSVAARDAAGNVGTARSVVG